MTDEYPTTKSSDIAVVGMSCKFPGAKDYEEFWENLKAGKSSIQEVPANRWDWKAYWGDPLKDENKSNSKWIGFIDDVDAFDHEFFNISRTEAEIMDPQQRMMLEMSWSCFEDAGVCPRNLTGSKVGVFMGVFNFDYKELQERGDQTSIQAHHSTGTATAVISNRISYYFDFKGPSLSIDTACSSSLNAIHAAMQSLNKGECEMALAGGISLLLTPTRHISFSKTGMLSPTGSCKTFDESADGYVRSEGAGLVLLKPLEKAMEAGDNIVGILKGSAVCHSGKTYTLTYPNPDAQADVIVEALEKAELSADALSYIEMHGTGTPKGDPIEFEGILNAFQRSLTPAKMKANKQKYCGLGSAKSNIGHAESAAGVAGLIKTLLSLNNKQLPGLQNFSKLNHRIKLTDTPFRMVSDLEQWEPLKKGAKIQPRRAGISSFGFGGTNAHLIVEEGIEPKVLHEQKYSYYLIGISAKTEEALLQKKDQLSTWLEKNGTEENLISISATLLLARERFELKEAFVVRNLKELKAKLVDSSQGHYFKGKDDPEEQPLFKELGKNILKDIKAGKGIGAKPLLDKLLALAELYVKGYVLEWDMLFKNRIPFVKLPTYPFKKDRHWISSDNRTGGSDRSLRLSGIHPLLHENKSNISQLGFESVFTGNEFFLSDHIVNGTSVLPGVCYLEMARKAMEVASGMDMNESIVVLKNVVWAQPIIIDAIPANISIDLEFKNVDEAVFEISSTTDTGPILHSQGISELQQKGVLPVLDIDALKTDCEKHHLSAKDCYDTFGAMGFGYGPGFQGINEIYVGEAQALAHITLPTAVMDSTHDYVLHPSLMDAAVQATTSLFMYTADGTVQQPRMALPFAIDRVEVHATTGQLRWAYIRYAEGSSPLDKVIKLDLDICNEAGEVCVGIMGFSSRTLSGKPRIDNSRSSMLLKPTWVARPIEERTKEDYETHLVLSLGLDRARSENLPLHLSDIAYLALHHEGVVAAHYPTYAYQVFEEIKKILQSKIRGNALVQLLIPQNRPWLSGLSGLLKTAHLENPKFYGQLIAIDEQEDAKDIAEKLLSNSKDPSSVEIRYDNGKREAVQWEEETPEKNVHYPPLPWKDKGVYLITGGAGGLGKAFAKEIMTQSKQATVVLMGRSALDKSQVASLEAMAANEGQVVYRKTDLTNKSSVSKSIAYIVKTYGRIDGILHSAGIIRDNYILLKEKTEFEQVLGPKVQGLINLDHASRDVSLDFLILFSSTSGALGNPGQSDYAVANAFMDGYAHYRNQQVTAKERKGQTLSINWPLWKEGGMQIDELAEKAMYDSTGILPMDRDTGIRAFYGCLSSGLPQTMVIAGDLARARTLIMKTASVPEITAAGPTTHSRTESREENRRDTDERGLEKKTVEYLKKILSATLKTSPERLDATAPLEKYGIDSILVMALTGDLEKVFGSLSKTLFFEYQNINELAAYFLDSHRDRVIDLLEVKGMKKDTEVLHKSATAVNSPIPFHTKKVIERAVPDRQKETVEDEGIAIIGLAGQYPKAKNIQEYWNNLKEGRDCITEIPKNRWDYRPYFDKDKSKQGKTYSKWGGFLDEIDKFDPMLFNISPREAMMIDPQERLFLQCVYEVMNDAGYTREALQEYKRAGIGGNVGVYAGVMYGEYQLYGIKETMQGNPLALASFPSSIANRVSYFCNFHGPSIAVDTMCSSSLTTVHLACESLYRQECSVAIAGGVNLSIHPNKYLLLGQGGFISSKGYCESFGQGGDGYVPGEGVGAVMLKPLSKAMSDGDHIYGVIKGTVVNHGGKTNGYSVPNPNAQASLIGHAFEKAGINPRSVSYIEAHGTGTSLGDPIEIAGLSKAFKQKTKDKQFCAIGSAKSNIGHCESAAGISGLTKVLLQLKHQQIAPSLHSTELNPNIDFDNSPFVVQQNLSNWQKPTLMVDGQQKEFPRIAGVSSFGAGGANAHVILEEYVPVAEKKGIHVVSTKPWAIVLSAKTEMQVKTLAARLLQFITVEKYTSDDLPAMAYTLLVGREEMEHRFALTVTTIDELKDSLHSFIKDERHSGATAHVKYGDIEARAFAEDETTLETTARYLEKGNTEGLIDLWLKGAEIDWNRLYTSNKPGRIRLPAYPFAKKRCWITGKDNPDEPLYQVKASKTDTSKPPLGQVEVPLGNGSKKAEDISKPLSISLSDLSTVTSGKKVARTTSEIVPGTAPKLQLNLEREMETAPRAPLPNTTTVSGPTDSIVEALSHSLAKALYMDIVDIDIHKSFIDMGLDSIIGVEWISHINKQYGLSISATVVYDHTTIHAFAHYLEKVLAKAADVSEINNDASQEVLSNTTDTEHRSRPSANNPENHATLEKWLAQSLAEALYMDMADVDIHTSFVDMGLDSIIGVEWISTINKQYGLSISATKVYDYTTIKALAGFLVGQMDNLPATATDTPVLSETISQEKRPSAPLNPVMDLTDVTTNNDRTISTKAIAKADTVPDTELETWLTQSLADALYMDLEDVHIDKSFVDMGLDSIIGVEWVQSINKRQGMSIPAVKLYDHTTIRTLATYIREAGRIGESDISESNRKEMAEVESVSNGYPEKQAVQLTMPSVDIVSQASRGMESLDQMIASVQNGSLDFNEAADLFVSTHNSGVETEVKFPTEKETAYAPEVSKVAGIIIEHLREVVPELAHQPIGPEDSLKDLGANSVDRAEIIMKSMATLAVQVPLTALVGARNIGELAEMFLSQS